MKPEHAEQPTECEQKQELQKALGESEHRFRAFVDVTSDVVYRMNGDWSQMLALWGREFIADTQGPHENWLKTYIHPDDQGVVMAAIRQAIQSKSPFQLEHRVYRKDGTLAWTFSRATPMFDDQGNITEWFGIAHDITPRKEAEQKLADSLERERQARLEAEKAVHAKDEFLAMLSHELRTPLNPVLLIASDCADNFDLPDEIRQDFLTILKNIEVESRIIDDLLDLNRMKHGKFKLHLTGVDIHLQMREALQTIQEEIAAKHIQIATHLEADDHWISGDSVRLKQVFWNLLKNALKFTPDGGRITIETWSTATRFIATFTDTGLGMTAEEMKMAFSAFEQGEHAQKKANSPGGLGLGLAISKKILDMHSGDIRASSEGRGRGSSFTVELPLATSPGSPGDGSTVNAGREMAKGHH